MIVSLELELLERLSRLDGTVSSTAVEELDSKLAAAVRRTASMRRVFYACVLVVALYGTATGAAAEFDLPWWIAIGGILALELGGVVFLSIADVRRRLGEQAVMSRLLGGVIAASAAIFNVLTHRLLTGGFFALMSVLGFVTWWLDVEAKRRDRLRVRGQLAATSPTYELWGHWMRHPIVTARARSLAKAYPQLGLYGSLEAALLVMAREKRSAALTRALHVRIRRAVSKDMAEIATLTFDMEEVARRLRHTADYDGLTALLGSELTAERVLHGRNDQAATAARSWLSAQTSASTFHSSAAQPLPTDAGAAPPDHRTESADATDARRARPSTAVTDEHRNADGLNAVLPAPAWAVEPSARINGGRTPAMLDATHARVTVVVPGGDPVDANSAETGCPPASLAATTAGRPAAAPPSARPAGRSSVQVRVIGTPAILDGDGNPVRGLRTKSIELLAYLAVHRHGASLDEIIEALLPGVPDHRAAQRLSTCLGNLRATIRAVLVNRGDPAGTAAKVEPVVNTGGHYHLDPAVIAVDWWTFFDERPEAKQSPELTQHLAGRLADGCNYPWLDRKAVWTRSLESS